MHGNQWVWVAARIVHLRAAEVVFGYTSLGKSVSEKLCGRNPMDTPVSRLVEGLVISLVEVVVAFSAIRRSGGHGAVQIVEHKTVINVLCLVLVRASKG